jgi:hypothetical protein
MGLTGPPKYKKNGSRPLSLNSVVLSDRAYHVPPAWLHAPINQILLKAFLFGLGGKPLSTRAAGKPPTHNFGAAALSLSVWPEELAKKITQNVAQPIFCHN